MNPSEMSFSIHDGNNSYHEEPGQMIIIFCPQKYWDKHKCLPDYYFVKDENDLDFSDEYWDIGSPPDGYRWYIGEEIAWCSKKSKKEIQKDLSKLGFVENTELEKFLNNLWNYED